MFISQDIGSFQEARWNLANLCRFALEREIREELDVMIRVDDEYFSVAHAYPSRMVRIHFFNCSMLNGEPKLLGVADLRWVEAVELGRFQFPAADEELIKRLQGDVLNEPNYTFRLKRCGRREY